MTSDQHTQLCGGRLLHYEEHVTCDTCGYDTSQPDNWNPDYEPIEDNQ